MERADKTFDRIKKHIKPTSRETNMAVLTLRALQLGLSYEDTFVIEVGTLKDLLIEKGNDSFDYPEEGTAEDLKKMLGG